VPIPNATASAKKETFLTENTAIDRLRNIQPIAPPNPMLIGKPALLTGNFAVSGTRTVLVTPDDFTGWIY